MKEGLSFVCWRMPGEKTYHRIGPVVAGKWDGGLPEVDSFVFAPFDVRDNPALVLSGSDAKSETLPAPKIPRGLDKEHYIQWVNTCLKEIGKDRFQKLVAARIHEESREGFDAANHFNILCEKYPRAFCYLLYAPSAGTWLGATPELFLEFSANKIKTVALAGTQAGNENGFGVKEEEEQELVVDFVRETLQPFASDISVAPKNRIASGHLVHLINEISGTPLKSCTEIPALIKALHPTPAVAGIPKQQAVDFIRASEGFDRAYYSGFLGPVNKEKGNLFVNLRCMQNLDNRQFYYVGAGITRLSNAESEWSETEEKRRVVAP